jgi:hypothetical protein
MDPSKIPEKFDSIDGFGILIDYYPIHPFKRWLPVVFGIIFSIISLAAFIYGVFVSTLEIRQHGAVVFGKLFFLPGLIALLSFFAGAWMAWLAFRKWNLAAAVFQNGFAYHGRKGMRTWLWQDVVSLLVGVTRHYTFGFYTSTSHSYIVELKSGDRLVLNDSISRVEELIKWIGEKTFPDLFSQASQLYNSGEKLVFGKVSLDTDGLRIGEKEYSWDQIERTSLHQGTLKITGTGDAHLKEVRVPVNTIPNFHILISVLNQLTGVQIGK